ncbi:MAG TPA: alanine--tRNA ligase [Pyrinomonadaceae bacterium]|nr:alanine--tRNA ligase [Pyrinomonadaceae bacterium]
MSSYENLSDVQQFACRVIADHARSTAFSIADGILPGNEGRNYVLRKIMRRAIYHGREHLGFKDLFFHKVCDFVISEMHAAYPELEAQREFIGKMVRLEEERFGNTMTVGLGKLNELDFTGLEGSKLFLTIAKLYDTYGTPRDLIRVFLEEKDIEFDEDDYNSRFDAALQELQKQSGIGQTERKSQISPVYSEVLERVGANKFHGYETTHLEEAKVVAILDGDKPIDSLSEGAQGSIVLSDTPFYAESGGQVGDVGILVGTAYGSGRLKQGTSGDDVKPPATAGGSDFKATVADTYSPITGLIIHKVKVEKGSIKVGDEVVASVDVEKRNATRRNHTATHLVHAALKEVLGSHVKQGGSVVAPNYLRFDFTHYQPLTETEISEVEDLVNGNILANHDVNTNIMAIEEAMKSGAVALFGEKYGSDVRVLSVGDGVFSKELCGGTHVKATGDIGSFKITSDEAIASGVRRIRAITGFDAFDRFREDERLIDRSLGALKTQRDNLPNAIERLQEELKRTRKEIDDLKLKIATGAIGGASSNGDEAREINGVKVIGRIVEGLDANGTRQLSDTLLSRLKSGVVILGREADGKVSIIVRVSDDLTDKVKAGSVIKEIAPIVGGRGGGKPDMAEGGGSEPDKLSQAIDASYTAIENMLK